MKKLVQIFFVFVLVSSSMAQPTMPIEPHKMDVGGSVPIPKKSPNAIVEQISTIEYAYKVIQNIGWENMLTTIFQIAFLVFLGRTLLPSLSRKTEIDKRVLELIRNIYDELLDAREGQVLSGQHLEIISKKYGNRLNVELSIRVMKEMVDCTMYETLYEIYKHKVNSPDDTTSYIFDKIYRKLETDMHEIIVIIRQFKFTGDRDGRELNLSELFNEERVNCLLRCVQASCTEHNQIDRVTDAIYNCFQNFKNSIVDEVTTA